MSKSPVITEFGLSFWFLIRIKSLIPTSPRPQMTKAIPVHSLVHNFLFKNPTDKRPVKTITEPRNI